MDNPLRKTVLTFEIQDFQVLTVEHLLYLTLLTNVQLVCIFNFSVCFVKTKRYFSDVCWLRLDFESFTLQGTGNTEELNGGVCLDSFTVSVCICLKVFLYIRISK